jgi:hypothetical protein
MWLYMVANLYFSSGLLFFRVVTLV